MLIHCCLFELSNHVLESVYICNIATGTKINNGETSHNYSTHPAYMEIHHYSAAHQQLEMSTYLLHLQHKHIPVRRDMKISRSRPTATAEKMTSSLLGAAAGQENKYEATSIIYGIR